MFYYIFEEYCSWIYTGMVNLKDNILAQALDPNIAGIYKQSLCYLSPVSVIAAIQDNKLPGDKTYRVFFCVWKYVN